MIRGTTAVQVLATAGRSGGARTGVLVATLSFAAGLACAEFTSTGHAQNRVGGTLTELKRVDLGSWCQGKEVVISTEEIAPQHQGKHSHPAFSFAWMIEGSQTRFVDGKPPQTFQVGDVTQEDPGEISESDILTPTKVLLFRILQKGQPATTRVQ
jgi:quercetin dioxygenase-like cupin family protein